MVEPIQFPTDPRVEDRYAVLNGTKYHYLYAEPKNGQYTHTVFLVSKPNIQSSMLIEFRFMDGQTSLLDGDIKSPCSLTSWAVEWLFPT